MQLNPSKYIFVLLLLLLSPLFGDGHDENYIKKSIEFEKKNIDSALDYANRALSKGISEKNEAQMAEGYYQLAHLQKNKGEYNSALKNCFSALALFEKLELYRGIVKSRTLIGACYSMSGSHKLAKKYFLAAIEIGELKDERQVSSYIGLGNVFYYQDSIEEAEKIYLNAISLIEETGETSATMTAGIFTNLGNIKFMQDELESAKEFYEEGYRMYKNVQNKFGMCIASYNIGEVYYILEDFPQAEKYYNLTLELGTEIKSIDDIEFSLQSLSDVYKSQGKYEKALEYRDRYHSFRDSVSSITHQKEVDELQIKYENQKNESILRKQDKLIRLSNIEKLNSEQYSRFLLWGIIALAVIAVLSIFSFIKIKKKNYIIQEAKMSIDQNLKEKDLLLKEIHHRVKNNLQMISSLLNLQTYSLTNKDAIQALEESKNRVQAIALVHKKLYQNTKIGDVNLHEYIKDLTQWMGQFTSLNNQIKYNLEIEDINLDVDTVVPLGLIICELISNSQKHAFTDDKQAIIDIFVTLKENGSLQFEYRDNGKGLPEDFSIENLSSLGFEIIESLTEQLDGTLTFGSKYGMFLLLDFQRI